MKIKDKIPIDALYFGVVLNPISYASAEERNTLKTYNLFDFARVKYSVAMWVTMSPEEKARRKDLHSQLMWCFGDTWSRTEFEFIVCPWGGSDEDDKVFEVGRKVDIFSMYVEPNGALLMDLVNRVSESSARAFLREWNKRYKK